MLVTMRCVVEKLHPSQVIIEFLFNLSFFLISDFLDVLFKLNEFIGPVGALTNLLQDFVDAGLYFCLGIDDVVRYFLKEFALDLIAGV